MLILGLNAYHADSAACMIKNGCLVAAAEEERFRRMKHWAGLPTRAIDFCLNEVGVSLGEIEHIAINRRPGVNNWRRLAFVLSHRPDPRLMWQRSGISAVLPRPPKRSSTRMELHFPRRSIMSSSTSRIWPRLFSFPASRKLRVCPSMASAISPAPRWGGAGERMEISSRVYFPHSLGIFYSAITQFIGFPHYGYEYKVMGLAPYGEPNYLERMREIVRVESDGTFKLNLSYFRHHTDNVSYSWNDCSPEVGTLFKPESSTCSDRSENPEHRSSKDTKTSRVRFKPSTKRHSSRC